MKLGAKLARKVSLEVLVSLMDRESHHRDEPPTFPRRKATDTPFIKPSGAG